MSRIRVLALSTYPIEAASSRYRVMQFVEPLSRRGIDVTFSPFLDASLFAALYDPDKFLRRLPRIAARSLVRLGTAIRAARSDAIFLQREAMLFGPPVVEWLGCRLLRTPLILDLDDATWISYRSLTWGRLGTILKWPGKTNHLIRWASAVTCGSPKIAEYARSLGAETSLVPTIVDPARFRPAVEGARGERGAIPTIGWIGTHGTYPCFRRLLPLFERLAREMPFRLKIVGHTGVPPSVPGVEVECHAWRLDKELADFQSLDAGVYPIADDEWSAAKGGFKAVQYMAAGVPFVMSPVGVCATMGLAGETHFNAVTDDEWLDALGRLVSDGGLRKRMSIACRGYAEQHYDVEAQADSLESVIRAAISRGSSR